MSWDDIKENESDFIKIEAGKNVKIHLLSQEPEKHVSHFVTKGKPPEACLGPACELCKAGNKNRLSFTASVFNMGTKKEQKMEQGIMVWKQIKTIKEAYGGNLDTVDLMITREGAGQNDTKYTVVPVPSQFKPEMLTAKAEEIQF